MLYLVDNSVLWLAQVEDDVFKIDNAYLANWISICPVTFGSVNESESEFIAENTNFIWTYPVNL